MSQLTLTGVAIILQVDELLASYVKIKDINPKLLSGAGSWKTKMLLSSKLALVVILGFCVYLITLVVWYTDRWYTPILHLISHWSLSLGLVGTRLGAMHNEHFAARRTHLIHTRLDYVTRGEAGRVTPWESHHE